MMLILIGTGNFCLPHLMLSLILKQRCKILGRSLLSHKLMDETFLILLIFFILGEELLLGPVAVDISKAFFLELGKGSVTPENTAAVDEALAARELIKISVLQNCLDDPRQMAEVLAERTHAQVVQVIGRKIVLYREGKKEKKKIILP